MTGAFPGRLNLFQRTMLRWRELAPYNAVHAAEIAGTPSTVALREAIVRVVSRWGIAAHALDRSQRRFAYGQRASFSPALECVEGGAAPDTALASLIERELNRPFPSGEPLRFFAVTGSGRTALGIAYDHYVAGGDSIAALLGELVDALTPGTPGVPPPPPPLYPPTYAALARAQPRWFASALAAVPALARESKRTVRLRDRDPAATHNAYALFRLDAADTQALRARARAIGVTLHDLVLALVLQTVAPIVGESRRTQARSDLAVAAIVNVRRDFGVGHAHDFGQFLASMRIVHPVPPDIALEAVARDVRAVTDANKRKHLYLRTLYGLAVAAAAWPLLSRSRRLRFFAKHHGAWAGVSMLAADPDWPERVKPAQRYTRGVSTGPLTPAVLAVSLTPEAMSIGVSWRHSVLPADFAQRLEAAFRRCARPS